MPAANIGAKWISGNLVVFDKLTGSSIATFKTGSDGVEIVGPVKIGSTTSYTYVLDDGTIRLVGDATSWRDMIGNLFGAKLSSSAGKVDYNFDENSITFNTGGSLAVEADRVQWNQEINHQYVVGEGVSFKPHIHFWQTVTTGDVVPFVFSLKYRLQRNGYAKAADWTTITATSGIDDIFDFTGEDDDTYCQILAFPEIEEDCGVSDTFQFQMARTDSETGDVDATFIDLHGAVDSLGSETEYIKS